MNLVIFQDDIVNRKRNNYFRNYGTIYENVLDVINTFGDLGLTSEEITNLIGTRASGIRRVLAKMTDRINSRKYFIRKREGSFKYFKINNFNPKAAYQDIINSRIEKVTLNQIGLKNSSCFDKLIENGEIFCNVINTLKKSKSKWLSVAEISEKLGVDNKRGKGTIRQELCRCLNCSVKFVEFTIENNIKKFRIIYKYRKHTVLELKHIANKTFPYDNLPKISRHEIQVLNNLSDAKKGLICQNM